MLKLLVSQVQRLFSSRSNGGRLVRTTTNKLHGWKQVLLALSIALVLGYTQFRENFDCIGHRGVDSKYLISYCWTNGTSTLSQKSPQPPPKGEPSQSQVGMLFKFNDDRKLEQVSHNYMRSIWLLLLLMAACSYVALRDWALIFQDATLVALLKLPGHEKVPQFSAPAPIGGAWAQHELGGDAKELEHYVNRLIQVLVTRSFETNLRAKLMRYHAVSLSMTLLQFALPWMFIGDAYLNFGWDYLKSLLRYFLRSLKRTQSHINTVDYEISGRIFPTMATCSYRHYGEHKLEGFSTNCSIPFNEICGKLFAAVWWLTAINAAVELYACSKFLFSSYDVRAARWLYGKLLWPEAREQAQSLVNFRFRRLRVLDPEHSFAEKKLSQLYYKDDGELQSSREIMNVYFLLYLVYLRLNCSQRKIECVIRTTSARLTHYSENLCELGAIRLVASNDTQPEQQRASDSPPNKDQ